MNTQAILSPKEQDILWQIKDSVDKYVPLLRRWVERDMPYNDHLQKALEQQMWINTVIEEFGLGK